MISDEYTALLDAFADGELSGADAERVRAHLDECAACRAYLDDVLAIRAAFPSVEETVVPDGFADAVLSALPPCRVNRVYLWKKAALPLAAALAVVVLARGLLPRMGSTGGAAPEYAVESAAAGGGYGETPEAYDETPEETEEAAADSYDMDSGAPVPAPAAGEPETFSASSRSAATAQEAYNRTAEAPKTDPEAVQEAAEPEAVPEEEAAEKRPADEPAEPENGQILLGDSQEYAHTLLTLPPEAAPLLSEREPYQTVNGGSWYALSSEEEFRALLKGLSDAGIQPSAAPVESLVNPPAAPYLVFVEKE